MSRKAGEKMQSVLHEFYYGNINLNEKPFNRDSEYKKVLHTVSENEEKLFKLLDGTVKELKVT